MKLLSHCCQNTLTQRQPTRTREATMVEVNCCNIWINRQSVIAMFAMNIYYTASECVFFYYNSSGNDIYWKEIGAAIALTTMAKSHAARLQWLWRHERSLWFYLFRRMCSRPRYCGVFRETTVATTQTVHWLSSLVHTRIGCRIRARTRRLKLYQLFESFPLTVENSTKIIP